MSGKSLVKIVVIDTGIGIAANHLPRLFERFYSSDKARSRAPGETGLGLAIVKRIVQAHNGRVDVTSQEGMRTTFILLYLGDRSIDNLIMSFAIMSLLSIWWVGALFYVVNFTSMDSSRYEVITCDTRGVFGEII